MGSKYFNQKFVEVRANKLCLTLPNKLNPRASLDTRLIGKLEKSLKSLSTDFSALNNGMVVIVSDNYACLETGKNVVSIINGGHTYRAICNLRAKLGEIESDPHIWVRLIQAEDLEHIAKISKCLNTTSKLSPRLLRNAEGKYDHIKSCIPAAMRGNITWRTTVKMKGKTSPDLLLATLAGLSGSSTGNIILHKPSADTWTTRWESFTEKKLVDIIKIMEVVSQDLSSFTKVYKLSIVERVSILTGESYCSASDSICKMGMLSLCDSFDFGTHKFLLPIEDLLKSSSYQKFKSLFQSELDKNEKANIKISPAFIVRNVMRLIQQRKGKI